MDRPLVSVVLPCWNAEGSIERALGSVLEERDVNLECIVVDDGSTDRTAELIAAVATADPRVVSIRLPANGGVSNARNRGLEVARGDWLTFLDSDDKFYGGGLAALLEAAIRTDALAVVGQQVWVDPSHSWISSFYDNPDIREPGRKSLTGSPGLLYYVSPHAKLFRRAMTEGLAFEGRVLGDQPWTIRALLRAGDRIEVIGDTVYEWTRSGPTSAIPSITTTSRSSAHRAVEAVGVAELALASVREEAARLLTDAEADELAGRYVARLLRSDLGPQVAAALGRGDPATGELLAAIERFVGAVPGELLTTSGALATVILVPPLRHWRRLPVEARESYWSLWAAALRADPEALRRAGRRTQRLALRLAHALPHAVGPLAARVALWVGDGASIARRALRLRRRA